MDEHGFHRRLGIAAHEIGHDGGFLAFENIRLAHGAIGEETRRRRDAARQLGDIQR
ncbi:hypothetical protein [Mesorhizobium jarvisii]|uniref:hypothetical protein n=1 Tax=Mesorhizobium jarvisii TaxID=1777867 RepID=UPI001495EB7B|nr:hypothetical protein [Mesorhizobium jarvisii]